MPRNDLTPNAGQQMSMAPWGFSRRVSRQPPFDVPTRWRKRETNSVPGGRKLMRLRSRPEPFMHEKQAEEAPGQARPRRRMRSRNIPANSGPAGWSFIVQRAGEAYPLRHSPEKQAVVWESDRFQDRPGRRAGPARRSRGSRRCTFPLCRRACARKC